MRRTWPWTPAPTETRRNAGTGRALPLAFTGSTDSAVIASRTRRHVGSPMRTSPGFAACSSRAAVLTVSPVTSVWPEAGSPATTSPVVMPVRVSICTPCAVASSALRVASDSRICTAARTARSASSSCSTGMPKTAMTASPMNFSTVPPCRSITSFMAAKYRLMRPRTASGSRRSPMAVDPVTSLNRIVTTLRASRAGSKDSGSRLPHSPQNFGAP